MKFTRVWCYGGEKRDNEDDFVVRYIAENGSIINVEFLINNQSWRSYRVNGDKTYSTLKEAKAHC